MEPVLWVLHAVYLLGHRTWWYLHIERYYCKALFWCQCHSLRRSPTRSAVMTCTICLQSLDWRVLQDTGSRWNSGPWLCFSRAMWTAYCLSRPFHIVIVLVHSFLPRSTISLWCPLLYPSHRLSQTICGLTLARASASFEWDNCLRCPLTLKHVPQLRILQTQRQRVTYSLLNRRRVQLSGLHNREPSPICLPSRSFSLRMIQTWAWPSSPCSSSCHAVLLLKWCHQLQMARLGAGRRMCTSEPIPCHPNPRRILNWSSLMLILHCFVLCSACRSS